MCWGPGLLPSSSLAGSLMAELGWGLHFVSELDCRKCTPLLGLAPRLPAEWLGCGYAAGPYPTARPGSCPSAPHAQSWLRV